MPCMTGAIRGLFWTWLIVSSVILVVRLNNKRAKATAPTVDGRLSWWDSLLGKVPAEPSPPLVDRVRPSAGSTPTIGTDRPDRPPLRDSDGSRSTGATSTPTPGGSPATADPARESPTDRGDPGDGEPRQGRQGFFATADDGGGQAPAAVPARTIADAVAGLDWPCGLTPVIDLSSQHLADREVAFWTTDASPEEVGARLGDALESLGYSLSSTTDTRVVARRPGAELDVRLHPAAGKAERAGQPQFPSLPAQAVVVVLTLMADAG